MLRDTDTDIPFGCALVAALSAAVAFALFVAMALGS